MEGIIHRLLDREFMRIECALEKNFEYLDKLDRMREEATMRELERLRNPTAISATSSKKKAAPKNTSVYIMGLTTYIACKQLENVCSRLGRVKRIKFYKDDRGGLKGDALVTFATNAAMEAAVAKLNNFEIKPGVRITAKVAEFSKKQEEPAAAPLPLEATQAEGIDAVTAFLNDIQKLHPQVNAHVPSAPESVPAAAPPIQETTASEVAPEAEAETAVLETPSRSILLYNIIDCEPTTAEDCLDLEEDLQMECSNYGKVLRVQILQERKVVIVEYESLPSAIKCLEVMNGRWFGGTQIRATFDPSAPEEPEDEDTKLLAFLASV